MHGFITQLNLLLAALGVALPLVPARSRAELGRILETMGAALALGEAAASGADALSAKFKALRQEVEAMAEAGRAASPEALEAAYQRVRAASAAFRQIVSTSASA